jgi:hypothetical protein
MLVDINKVHLLDIIAVNGDTTGQLHCTFTWHDRASLTTIDRCSANRRGGVYL